MISGAWLPVGVAQRGVWSDRAAEGTAWDHPGRGIRMFWVASDVGRVVAWIGAQNGVAAEATKATKAAEEISNVRSIFGKSAREEGCSDVETHFDDEWEE